MSRSILIGQDWAIPGDISATAFRIAADKVVVSALIAGNGIDLVVKPPGGRSRTIQLTVDEARELAQAVLQAADESEHL